MEWARRERRSLRRGNKGFMLKGLLMVALTGTPFASHAQYALPRADGGGAQQLPPNLARVVGGEAASHTDWTSFALVRVQTAPGKTKTCGGTIIGRQWALTAGHCVSGRSAASLTVIEGIDDLNEEGHKIAVDRIVLHEEFADQPPRNDIALLHLASQANSASQVLMSRDLADAALHDGANTLLAGFGLTTPQPVLGAHTGAISTHLLQASLPIVERSRCARILAQVPTLPSGYASSLSESMLCAGDIAGGRDACNGDSGGPLAMTMKGRRVQVGVVSWGPGCGLRDTVGVYTSVGYFEDWIRQRAPDAIFVAAAEERPPAPVIPTPPASQNAEPCGLPPLRAGSGVRVDVAEGSRVRIGEAIHVRATPNLSGQLLVFNIDIGTCRTKQLFPNAHSRATRIGSVIVAGETVLVPGSGIGGFRIQAQPPAGPNRLYAMIIPAGVPIGDLASRGVDMQNLIDAPLMWRELSSRAWRTPSGTPPVEAVGMFSYEIVP